MGGCTATVSVIKLGLGKRHAHQLLYWRTVVLPGNIGSASHRGGCVVNGIQVGRHGGAGVFGGKGSVTNQVIYEFLLFYSWGQRGRESRRGTRQGKSYVG